jgi:DNA replication licensing factor MCM7
LAHREQKSLEIDLDHVADFDPDLCERIEKNTRRYIKLFSDAIEPLLSQYRVFDVRPRILGYARLGY